VTTVGGPEPDTIGGYRLDELVGRGGMGDVYRAWDERLERWVALKLLPARLAGDEGFRERLLRESRLAASLDHPNVVPVYEAGEADGRLFLAMRYVEGTDLRAILRAEGTLEPGRAIAIASQIAAALDAAHASGLVHRDVKPSNVLVDANGHCYLADFGLSERVAAPQAPTDRTVVGTLDYVAPEQIRGDPGDAAADRARRAPAPTGSRARASRRPTAPGPCAARRRVPARCSAPRAAAGPARPRPPAG
jgi:serine/threonine protein kinase